MSIIPFLFYFLFSFDHFFLFSFPLFFFLGLWQWCYPIFPIVTSYRFGEKNVVHSGCTKAPVHPHPCHPDTIGRWRLPMVNPSRADLYIAWCQVLDGFPTPSVGFASGRPGCTVSPSLCLLEFCLALDRSNSELEKIILCYYVASQIIWLREIEI